MNKYSKKKSIWKTTCELHPGPVYATLTVIVLAIFYIIGLVIYHVSGFSILNWLLEEGYMGFLDNILTGFILIGFATIIICSIWCIIIEPILKQVAIARECICVTLMKCYDKENISCFENLNDGMFLLHNKAAKMTEVPITVSSWGLYGKAYKENADNYFKED